MAITVHNYQPGQGIVYSWLNEDFNSVKDNYNTQVDNINNLNTISIKTDGSNLTEQVIQLITEQSLTPWPANNTITAGSIYELTPTSNVTIVPEEPSDKSVYNEMLVYIHGSSYSINLGTTHTFKSYYMLDATKDFTATYIWNPVSNYWTVGILNEQS